MKPLLQAKDVAKLLNCSRDHVYQLDRRGLLPCSVAWPCDDRGRDTRKLRRWTEQDVMAFIEKFKNGR